MPKRDCVRRLDPLGRIGQPDDVGPPVVFLAIGGRTLDHWRDDHVSGGE